MLGGIGAFIASEISGAVRRNVIVYGLMGFAALLLLCAGGYTLSALHTVLALRYGTAEASLFIAGGLLLAALIDRARPGASCSSAASWCSARCSADNSSPAARPAMTRTSRDPGSCMPDRYGNRLSFHIGIVDSVL